MSTRTVRPAVTTPASAPASAPKQNLMDALNALLKAGIQPTAEQVTALAQSLGANLAAPASAPVSATPATVSSAPKSRYAPAVAASAPKATREKDVRTPEKRYHLTHVEALDGNVRIGISDAPDSAPKERSGYQMVAPQNYRGTLHIIGVHERSTMAMSAEALDTFARATGATKLIEYLDRHVAHIVDARGRATKIAAEKVSG